MKLLTINDVSITTATVDIQVIRIGTKQMTLAVFRQLPKKEIFDRAGKLTGHPWGWVNYDHSLYGTPFVFSDQGILYRDDVDKAYADLTVQKTKVDYKCADLWDRWQIVSNEKEKDREKNYLLPISPKPFCYTFQSETTAHAYLANWQESIAILKTVPQLFIGV